MSGKVILFDFDGTLLYTIPDLGDAVNHGLSKFGYPSHDYPTIQSFVGNGVRKLVERALPDGEANPDFEKVFLKKRQIILYFEGKIWYHQSRRTVFRP